MAVRPPPPARDVRRARVAVAALFLTNGALFANVIPRYPGIKADLDLGDAVYGLAIAAFPAGALLAGLAAAPVIRRVGSARAAVVGTAVTALGTLLVGLSPSLPAFAAALFLAGSADAVADVAQNAHGLRVQRRYGRSVINSFHAVWSMGAVLGGSMAAGAIALGLSRGTHLATSAGVFALVALLALRWCLPGHDEDAALPAPDPAGAARKVVARVAPRTVLVLLALVAVATAGTLVEDAGSTWAAVYLSRDLGAPAAVAAYGFVALVAAQTVGRLVGDRLTDRFGQRAVVRGGGAVAAAGMGTALLLPSVPGTIAGFAAAGLGVAALVPTAMQQADELPGLRAGTGLTVLSWLMRVGFLVSPPVVGLVADTTSLRTGLLVVPLAGITAVLLAGVLRPRPGSRRAPAAGPVEPGAETRPR